MLKVDYFNYLTILNGFSLELQLICRYGKSQLSGRGSRVAKGAAFFESENKLKSKRSEVSPPSWAILEKSNLN